MRRKFLEGYLQSFCGFFSLTKAVFDRSPKNPSFDETIHLTRRHRNFDGRKYRLRDRKKPINENIIGYPNTSAATEEPETMRSVGGGRIRTISLPPDSLAVFPNLKKLMTPSRSFPLTSVRKTFELFNSDGRPELVKESRRTFTRVFTAHFGAENCCLRM
jgi:hypothetical protein